MQNKIKHLEMIEHIIERMARNCFQLKGWAMTLVAAVGALAAKDSDKRFMILAFIPVLVFWLLDSFYLQQERRYKALYRETAEKEDSQIDFNLDTSKVLYRDEESKRICFCKCLFSFSELLFYGALTGAMLALFLVLKVINV